MKKLVDKTNRWRAQYNPLRALTIQRAVGLLEMGERGYYADLQWLYRAIEKREPTLRALKTRRLSAIGKLDWQIKTVPDDQLPPGATPQEADRQAIALRAAYDRIGNLRAAIRFLALAEFRGFAHLEKIYADSTGSGTPQVVDLVAVEQWHWCRKDLYSPWLYNAQALNTIEGEPINPSQFIIREVEDPINEIALLSYIRKNLSQKDWDGFVEVYGLPPLFAVLPPNIPTGREDEYQAMAEAVVGDMRGVLPAGANMLTVGDNARGVNPFSEHLSYQDSQIVLAGTGGKLTMLNDPTGLGSGQSNAHASTFDSIAEDEALSISELFQAQFDADILRTQFPGQPALAYFELAAQDEEDRAAIVTDAATLSQAGYVMDATDLSERTGYKLISKPAMPLPSGSPFGLNRAHTLNAAQPDPVARIASQLQVPVDWLAPVRSLFDDLISKAESGELSDAELLAAADAATAKMPELFGQINWTALGDALESALGTAALDGVKTAVGEGQKASVLNRFATTLQRLFTRNV